MLNALRALEGEYVEFPLVPGRDFAGEVVAAGREARARRGQRVWGVAPPHRAGSHAQYVLVKDRWVSRRFDTHRSPRITRRMEGSSRIMWIQFLD